ncbi:MAG TPA: hypothetical protein VER79_05220 [Candidatus Limnocylindrales bacterium]|nr:hypothetical protein [Candidatus Limnocylindrales bacterium]
MARRSLLISFTVAIALLASSIVGQPDDGALGLPLLPQGQHVGVFYMPPEDPAAKTALDAAYGEVLQAGSSAYVLPISWAELEPSPGAIDTGAIERGLATLASLGLRPYLSITTINTVKLTLPPDLITANEYELADGRHFDDPVIVERFARLLDAIVPPLVAQGGFFVSVGNEVEGWLEARPDEVAGFVEFVAAARAHAHALAPGLGVGATITHGGVARGVDFLGELLAVSDAAAFTYYPLNDDFTVRDPSVAASDLAQMIAAVGDLPVLFQEVGYPSGAAPTPNNGSSNEQQRQFITNFFAAMRQQPQVRFASVLQFSDWSTAICDAFVRYYTGLDALPVLHEYLCSLGLHTADGVPKPAYEAFLNAVQDIAADREALGE